MSEKSHPSSARLLAAVSLAVVFAFIGANLYAQRSMVAIDANALALVHSIAPRIDHLTTLRGAIYRMDRAVRDAIAGRSNLAEAEVIAARERRAMTPHLDALNGTGRLSQKVAAFVREAQQSLRSKTGGNLAATQKEIESLGDAVAAIDQEVHELVTAAASDAARDGARIERLRIHASAIAYALNAVAGALSLTMVGIAFRIARQNERLLLERAKAVEERNALTERRAVELEAFAARVAHDLKNPITGMMLRLQVLQRPKTVDARDDAAIKIEQTLRRLVKIIDGLLAFATSGGAPDRNAKTSVRSIVKEVVSEIEAEASAGEVDLQITSVDAWSAVACPAATLSTILDNLVRNAVKFVVDGSGSSHVVVIRAEPRPATIRIEVLDNGPGIPHEEQSTIFAPYARGSEARRPGLGIGLATVKRLVEAYRGSVGVTSTVGVGSCFWVELPRA